MDPIIDSYSCCQWNHASYAKTSSVEIQTCQPTLSVGGQVLALHMVKINHTSTFMYNHNINQIQ